MKPNKRLIVCCDGTWQDLDCNYPTNVVKIAQAIKNAASDRVPQIIHYSEGVGTGAEKLDRLLGGAFGWGIDRRIQNAYRFLCCNYEDGDEIYLFGFSRGAYTVRSLAGLIYKCGLLSRCHIRKTKDAYTLYRDRTVSPSDEAAITFRKHYAVHSAATPQNTQIPITLLGCWDTVGALGVPKTLPLISHWTNKKYEFHDTKLNPKIQHALHAVAIDERRSAFAVTHMVPSDHIPNRKEQVTEVWFAGTHGCVGGGTEANHGLSDITLQWMMESIEKLGLGLEFVDAPHTVVEGGIHPDPAIKFADTMKGIYVLTGAKNRDLIDQKEDPETTLDEYFFAHKIHNSVKQRWQLLSLDPRYQPKLMLAFKQWFDAVTTE